MLKVATFVAVFVSYSLAQYKCSLKLEVEDGRGGLRQSRSRASGGVATALFEDEENIHELVFTSTNKSCSLELLSVTYSNDGDADRIEITLNNTLLANFTTYELHNDGHNWNAFRTEVGFQIKQPVNDGQIQLKVASRDFNHVRNRVELDYILVQIECSYEPFPTECPVQAVTENCPVNKDDNRVGSKTLAFIEIIKICGVVVSLLGVVSGYVLFGINLFCKLRKKRGKKSAILIN